MKTIISLMISLFTLQAFALELNDGIYISENCGKVEVARFQGHHKYADGDVRIGYSVATNDSEEPFSEVGYSIYSSDFFDIKKVSGLCMDDEVNLTPGLLRLSPTDMSIACGSPMLQVHDTLTVEADEAGELKSIKFVAKVAKWSLSGKVFVPLIQTTKANLECTNFVRAN